MNNPVLTAVLSGGAALYFGYSIFFADEAPGTLLAVINWAFFLLALFGLLGSLYKAVNGKSA